MPLLRNPLVEDLLQLADGLAMQTGRASFQQAALRRAVSTAYYAFFHALCSSAATAWSDGVARISSTVHIARSTMAPRGEGWPLSPRCRTPARR